MESPFESDQCVSVDSTEAPSRTPAWPLRVLLAFLLAPLVGTAVFAACLAGFAGSVGEIFPVLLPFAYGATLIFGFPAYLLLSHRGWLRWSAVVAGGGLVAALPVFLILLTAEGPSGGALALAAAFFLAGGCPAGLTFWLIAVRGGEQRRGRTSA